MRMPGMPAASDTRLRTTPPEGKVASASPTSTPSRVRARVVDTAGTILQAIPLIGAHSPGLVVTVNAPPTSSSATFRVPITGKRLHTLISAIPEGGGLVPGGGAGPVG